jgi:hypothetical protein
MPFHPERVTRFHLRGTSIDHDHGTVLLSYAFDDGAEQFVERIDFGPRRPDLERPELEAGFERIVRLLHLAAGVSYYKAAAPPVVVVEDRVLSAVERQFVLDLYDKGLREFAWHNRLPLVRRLCLEEPAAAAARGASAAPGASAAATPGGAGPLGGPPPGLGIPVGGGKDSAVVVEALRAEGPVLVSVNGHPAARRVAAAAGLDLHVVRRNLDPRLFELNAAGAYNGHVPITAIVSLIAVAAGYRLGYDTTVMALEGSADEPTRIGAGAVEVNHQWSKSSEFERALAAALADAVGPAVRYESVLRDTDELTIAACFATLRRYHRAFLSCNRAFSQAGADRWCGDCPKCRFVFLALATALEPADLVGIFGSDLLADPDQVGEFRALFEEGRKPFECVGTRSESLVAFSRLGAGGPWADHPVVRALGPIADTQLAAEGVGPGEAARVPVALSPSALLDQIRQQVTAPVALP